MENERLYRGLECLGLLYDSSLAVPYGTALEHYGAFLRETDWFRALPPELQRRYGLSIALNGMKFSLAAESFQRPLDREAVSAAASFVLAGRILDHMLDEGTPAERAAALGKLRWNYCSYYFYRFGPAKCSHVVDMLYSEAAAFLKKRKDTVPAAYKQVLAHLRRAARAESCTVDAAAAEDKSVYFTVIGFELALYGKRTPQEWETFFLIGDIFRVIDDMCDAEQDMLAGRVNSLLPDCGEWIEPALAALRRDFQRLEELVSRPFFDFIRYEVQIWTLDNACLHPKATEAPVCQTS